MRDVAFCERHDVDDGESEAFEKACGVFLVAAEAVQRLGKDHIGTAQRPSPHDFLMMVRAPEHPIMKGLPPTRLHAADELYSNLRGPARNVTLLATATAPTSMPNGTGETALVMAITYGKGRVFHDTLGHVGLTQKEPIVPMASVDYIVLLQRGTDGRRREL